jgi:pyridoxal 5'-phosphate synthase pdxS subunit
LSENPSARARAIVAASTYFDDPKKLADVSRGLGDAMRGLELSQLGSDQRLAARGW